MDVDPTKTQNPNRDIKNHSLHTGVTPSLTEQLVPDGMCTVVLHTAVCGLETAP
jgi:hypothetical protein